MRRRPRTLALAGLTGILLVLGGCGGGDGDGNGNGDGAAGTDTAATDTAAPETDPAGTETDAADGDPAQGAEVFASAGCENCHTLADAGATGTRAPNLDERVPQIDRERIIEQITNGGGGMPAFGDQLTDEQIRDVAAYLVEATS